MNYQDEPAMNKVQRFMPKGNCYECDYSFETGETLTKIFAECPEARGQALTFTISNAQAERQVIPPSTAGWRVKVGDTFIYLKTGIPNVKDVDEITELHRQYMGYEIYYPREKDLLSYWKKPADASNGAEEYTESFFNIRSLYLVSLIKGHCPNIESALEIGCNVGRNLHHIKKILRIPTAGIEYSEYALSIVNEHYPNLKDEAFIPGKAQDKLPELKDDSYDLVFSMAVLMHLHPSTPEAFWQHIPRVAKKNIITIESEGGGSGRNWRRNYRSLLEPHGLEEVFSEDSPSCFGTGYVTRVFKVK
ncbi:hypothetical protein SCG7109_AN_00050 [Chlamydiales bacterium SCGC AG-110-M15]|nr:hypothetical protein SCG7109_AN_00050 [Chlamydiales bacterium SCGC AG-110-M15]